MTLRQNMIHHQRDQVDPGPDGERHIQTVTVDFEPYK